VQIFGSIDQAARLDAWSRLKATKGSAPREGKKVCYSLDML
jgi:hypothetical protein